MPGFEIIGEDEREALNKLFDEGGILFAHGFDGMREHYHVRDFEVAVANRLGVDYALAVTSGTAAIKIGLKALGVKPGDEVITQAFNFIATIEAVLDIGAVPIIANCDESLNMDPLDLEKLITPKTKVLLPVHMLGVPADMDSILSIARRYDLKVFEDACEAVGATYMGRHLGTLGDASALSFDFGKVITCGEGGMVLTSQPDIDKFGREYHDHGHENNPKLPRGRDSRSIYGFNYRITEMQGVVGKIQLGKLDYIISENKKRYQTLVSRTVGLFQMRDIPDGSVPIYDAFIFFVSDEATRQKLVALLSREGFGTKNLPDAIEWHCAAYWNHALPATQVERADPTKELLSTAVAIPIWLRKSVEDYYQLGDTLREFVNQNCNPA